jgi:uncharacterized damage-inducible protein DinB
MADRFDKFTERARRVLTLAQEEALRFNHNYIGTEHILLGLVREGDGVAARVLNNLGIELHKVRSAVEFIIGRGDRMVKGEIGLTPRAKHAIELAVDEAGRLNYELAQSPELKVALEELEIIRKEKERLVVAEEYDRAAALREREMQLRERIASMDEAAGKFAGSSAVPSIGTEHLLLGLVREGEGIAAGVLESLGVSLEKVRAKTIAIAALKATPGFEVSTSDMPTSDITSAIQLIRTLFDYSIWARDQLLPVMESLEESQVRDAEHKGVYGSIHDTLAHLAVSEWMWLQRAQGESPVRLPKGEDFADLHALIDWWNDIHAQSMLFLNNITDADLEQEVTYTGPDGKTRTRKVWHMLLQVTNHQTEHRAQIGTMLGQMGLEVPQTDLVVYLSR